MGPKTQVGTRETRSSLRCEECKRDFQNLAAKKSHKLAKHSVKNKETHANKLEKKEEKKTALVPPTSRTSKRLHKKTSTDTKEIEAEETEKSVDIPTSKGEKKTVFVCPKCDLQFPVYFLAYRHIQKRHSEHKDAKSVEPNSTALIKPVAKEIMVDTNLPEEVKSSYSCLACEHIFEDVTSFNAHVEASHTYSLSSIVLSSMIEFKAWKTNIEAKQKLKYLSLSNKAQKQYYQCNYVSPKNSASLTHLCPSMFIVRVIPKGVKVNFHKDHFGHTCASVQLPNDISSSEEHNSADEFERCLKRGDDVSSKIKSILQTVIEKSSSLKKKQLKPIYMMSLKLEKYLNSIETTQAPLQNNSKTSDVSPLENDSIPSEDNQDELEEPASKSMTDDQITKALEAPRISARLKRKSESSPIPETKKNDKTGLKENKSQDLNHLKSPQPNIVSLFSQSPSFNDTYKQFIENSPKVELKGLPTIKQSAKTEKESPPLNSPPPKKVKKEIVKTKIGQFSPKNAVVVKCDTENETSKEKLKDPAKSKSSLHHVKLEEVDFEVVEQENDCNILILKI